MKLKASVELIEFAVRSAEDMEGGPLLHPQIAKAKERLVRVRHERQALAELAIAMATAAKWDPTPLSTSSLSKRSATCASGVAATTALKTALGRFSRFQSPPFLPAERLVAERLAGTLHALLALESPDHPPLDQDETGPDVFEKYDDKAEGGDPESMSPFEAVGAEGRRLLEPSARKGSLARSLSALGVSANVAKGVDDLGVAELVDLRFFDLFL
jgi:hypothetical protein